MPPYIISKMRSLAPLRNTSNKSSLFFVLCTGSTFIATAGGYRLSENTALGLDGRGERTQGRVLADGDHSANGPFAVEKNRDLDGSARGCGQRDDHAVHAVLDDLLRLWG